MVQVPVLAIHGGAGTINREALSAEAEREYRGALQSILEKGRDALTAGASALDAVTLAVSMLEDCPLFNAGRGAVYTSAETHEMDAAIMDGSTLRTGALSCVHGVKNPIRAARVVMEQSPHVLMTSDGAMAFLREHGVEFMPDAYFDTEHRLAQLHQAQTRQPGAAVLDHDGAAAASKLSFAGNPLDEKTKMGTVGAVALDSRGNLAAATSTGGMTNKLPGRVGDTPIVGAAGCAQCDDLLHRNGAQPPGDRGLRSGEKVNWERPPYRAAFFCASDKGSDQGPGERVPCLVRLLWDSALTF